MRSSLPVPIRPFVVEAVEEVRLRANGSHVRMDAQELQKRPSAAFLHPDDDGLRELFAAEVIRYRDVVGWNVWQLLPDSRSRGRVIRAAQLRWRFLSVI